MYSGDKKIIFAISARNLMLFRVKFVNFGIFLAVTQPFLKSSGLFESVLITNIVVDSFGI